MEISQMYTSSKPCKFILGHSWIWKVWSGGEKLDCELSERGAAAGRRRRRAASRRFAPNLSPTAAPPSGAPAYSWLHLHTLKISYAAPAYPQNIICCTWILLKYHMLHLYALKISYTPPIPHLYTPPIYSLAYPKKSYMLYLHTLCRICIPSKYLMLRLHTLKISNAASAYSLLHLDAFKKSFAEFTYS